MARQGYNSMSPPCAFTQRHNLHTSGALRTSEDFEAGGEAAEEFTADGAFPVVPQAASTTALHGHTRQCCCRGSRKQLYSCSDRLEASVSKSPVLVLPNRCIQHYQCCAVQHTLPMTGQQTPTLPGHGRQVLVPRSIPKSGKPGHAHRHKRLRVTAAYTAEREGTRRSASNSEGITMRRLSLPGEDPGTSETINEVEKPRQRDTQRGGRSRQAPAYSGVKSDPRLAYVALACVVARGMCAVVLTPLPPEVSAVPGSREGQPAVSSNGGSDGTYRQDSGQSGSYSSGSSNGYSTGSSNRYSNGSSSRYSNDSSNEYSSYSNGASLGANNGYSNGSAAVADRQPVIEVLEPSTAPPSSNGSVQSTARMLSTYPDMVANRTAMPGTTSI